MKTPRRMVLDPTKGFIFYTVFGRIASASVRRAQLDGTNETELVTHKVVYPYGITLDLPNEHIYWVDTYMSSIERVNYDGTNRRSIKRQPSQPSSRTMVEALSTITIFQNKIIFGTIHNHIFAMDKRTKVPKLIKSGVQSSAVFYDVFHKQKQPIGKIDERGLRACVLN